MVGNNEGSIELTDRNDLLFDFHSHIGFAQNPRKLLEEYNMHHIAGLAVTVAPDEYLSLEKTLPKDTMFKLALGAHPWWIHENKIDDSALYDMYDRLGDINYIGEIGLDFSKRFSDEIGRKRQLYWFDKYCEKLSQCIAQDENPRIMSIHSVQATDRVLDILESYGLPSKMTCIFHWFSGTHAQLLRAISMGCYFSININMLHSKRSESYMKTIPVDRMLLETDCPDIGQSWNGYDERELLFDTLKRIQELKDSAHGILDNKQQAKLLGIDINR